ncbi:MAG: M42 family metallopeptidase [Bacillota bacterium]
MTAHAQDPGPQTRAGLETAAHRETSGPAPRGPYDEEAELLGQLSEAAGVSGWEGEVRGIIRGQLEKMGVCYRTDHLGNIIAYRGPDDEHAGLRVMLAAHMDEVGLVVSGIDKSGLLRFRKVGGIDDRVLVSKRVLVGKSRVPGVIGAKPIHLQQPKEQENPFRAEELFVDIGARNKEEAEKVAKVGDPIVFATRFTRLGERRARGKAFDDRAGCLVLLGALREKYRVPVYGVFTVQEEVGSRGAQVAAYAIEPRLGLALEGTVCSDTPGSEEHLQATRMGAGPAISVMDADTIHNRRVIERLVEVARKAGIPYQLRRTTSGGNDAGRIHLARSGAAAGGLSVPCRYIHSPASVLDLEDLVNTRRLLVEFLHSLEEGWTP